MTESVQNKIIEIISVYIKRNRIDETEIAMKTYYVKQN